MNADLRKGIRGLLAAGTSKQDILLMVANQLGMRFLIVPGTDLMLRPGPDVHYAHLSWEEA